MSPKPCPIYYVGDSQRCADCGAVWDAGDYPGAGCFLDEERREIRGGMAMLVYYVFPAVLLVATLVVVGVVSWMH
jgi:hypothetical protein